MTQTHQPPGQPGIIRKPPMPETPTPLLEDYEHAARAFRWEDAARELTGLPDGRGLNIAHEAVDRHVAAGGGERTALRCIDAAGACAAISYAELAADSARLANVLGALGVGPGDRVVGLLPRGGALFVTALGTLKHRAVFCPLFSAFGPEPIRTRVALSGAAVLVTTDVLYARKVHDIRPQLRDLKHVLVVRERPDAALPDGVADFAALLATASPRYTIGPTDPEALALLHFTSGSTGQPKGAMHVHRAVMAHYATARMALDLRPEDVFWCTADPGWVTGTSYGIIAPLTIGATLIVDRREFDAERWCRLLHDQQVNVWYTAPTAIRMLMRYGAEHVRRHGPYALRFAASVGEPLHADAVVWGQDAFGLPFHDTWWQTETGAIAIANYASMDIKPGSMGRPMPGIEAAIVRRLADGSPVRCMPGDNGEIALRVGWPSMFRGYWGDDARYQSCFADGWYLTGDLARQDSDGYFWFVGRGDDVIKASGHLIGPFEVESVLMEHPAVAEAGVIGVPDPVAGETVKAFILLKRGQTPSDALARDIQAHARRRLGAAVAPKAIAFRTDLPKTRSGKIMRRLLKAWELGLPEGDVSTLERPEPEP